MIQRFIFIVSCFLFISASALAQGKKTREYSGFFDSYYYRGPVSYTAGIGLSSYSGDLGNLVESGFKPMFYIGAGYKLWPRVMFGANFMYSQLGATDWNKNRNIKFTGAVFGLDLFGRLYLVDDITRVAADRRKKPKAIKPYLTTGIGFIRYNATTTLAGIATDSAAYYPEKRSSGFALTIPVGLGFSFFITERVSLITEFSYRFTTTDYLDHVSARGNPGKRDGFGSVSFGVQFSPTAPKRKKRKHLGNPDPYSGPKGTETWKNRKKEEKKPEEEYHLPGEEQQNQEEAPQENNGENQQQEQQPAEENKDNSGW